MLENNFAFAVVRSEFPHVSHFLQDHWNEPDFASVMYNLLHPNPQHTGFPERVFNALYALALMHEMEVSYSARGGFVEQLLDLEH